MRTRAKVVEDTPVVDGSIRAAIDMSHLYHDCLPSSAGGCGFQRERAPVLGAIAVLLIIRR
jgi:hypothetical protein